MFVHYRVISLNITPLEAVVKEKTKRSRCQTSPTGCSAKQHSEHGPHLSVRLCPGCK